MEITLEENPNNKKRIVRDVLKNLPEWFGIDEALNEYVQSSPKYLLWVAKKDNEVLGFISLKETSPKVGEIYCMGVKKNFHHNRLGTQLFKELEQYAKGMYDFIQVKTVEQGCYKQYDCTIRNGRQDKIRQV